jgi:molybdopterin/thiamine biosynthesis adenylyltransferase
VSGPNVHRDARHMALAQVGAQGQERIAAASALVVGVGGLGCAAATYLASAGVGELFLVDFDTVDGTNLGRQVLFGPDDIGAAKAAVAADKLAQQNPAIRIRPVTDRLDDGSLKKTVGEVGVVLDCTDNFATRFQVNDACVATATCLVSGSAIRFEGQLAVFGPDYDNSPCYRCLYSEADESLLDCAGNGVFAPVPGVIGTMMAVEALKHLAGLDSPRGALRLYEGDSGRFHTVRIPKRADCPACGGQRSG